MGGPWIVYTYETVNGSLVCNAYGPFDLVADADAYVAKVGGTGITSMVLPLQAPAK